MSDFFCSDRDLMVATQIAYYDFSQELQDVAAKPLGKAVSEDRYILKRLSRRLKHANESRDPWRITRAWHALELFHEISSVHSPYYNWRVCYIKNDNLNSGFYGCLIETDKDEAIIGFRGSESTDLTQIKNDWVEADFGLLNSTATKQQFVASQFMQEIAASFNYKNYYLSGHSLGGNLAHHAALSAPQMMLQKMLLAVSFDGPGYSNAYIQSHQKGIISAGSLMKHYQWSFVGNLLYSLPHVDSQSIAVTAGIANERRLEALVQKHDTCFILFDSEGMVQPGQIDEFAQYMGKVSRAFDGSLESDSHYRFFRPM